MIKKSSVNSLSVLEPLELRLLPDEGLRFEEPLAEPWLEATLKESGAGPIRALRPGLTELEVQPLGPVATRPPIRVHGTLSAPLGMTCVRCLSPVELDLEGEVELTLFPEGTTAPKSNEAATDDELTDAELDEGTYGADAIDLPALLRETLLLELPMHPRCLDETACEHRTAEILASANRKSDIPVDDRWAALRSLMKEGKPGEES